MVSDAGEACLTNTIKTAIGQAPDATTAIQTAEMTAHAGKMIDGVRETAGLLTTVDLTAMIGWAVEARVRVRTNPSSSRGEVP